MQNCESGKEPDVKCWNCEELGHLSHQCTAPKKSVPRPVISTEAVFNKLLSIENMLSLDYEDGLRIQEKTATDLDSMKSEIKNQGQRTQDTIRDIEKQMQKLMQKQKQMLTFMEHLNNKMNDILDVVTAKEDDIGKNDEEAEQESSLDKEKEDELKRSIAYRGIPGPTLFIRDIGQDNVEKVRIFFYSYCGDVPKVVLLKKKQMPESQKQKQKRLYPNTAIRNECQPALVTFKNQEIAERALDLDNALLPNTDITMFITYSDRNY